MQQVDKLFLGRNRRVKISNFEWGLDRRDDMIKKMKMEDATERGDMETVKKLKKAPITAWLN